MCWEQGSGHVHLKENGILQSFITQIFIAILVFMEGYNMQITPGTNHKMFSLCALSISDVPDECFVGV